MKKIEEDTILISKPSISRSELFIDYLECTIELEGFETRKPKHRQFVLDCMEEAGLPIVKSGVDWVRFANEQMGISVFVSDFPMNNRNIKKRPSMKISFSGRYFIHNCAIDSSKKLIRKMSDKFGSFARIGRVDIAQDIYGAKYPFDYYPDFRKKSSPLFWAHRGTPYFNQFNNDFSETTTGFSIQNSRYKNMSYNRKNSLHDRLKSGDIPQYYFDFHMAMYKDRDVQRHEVKLKQDACNFFAVLFFQGEKPIQEILQLSLANFGRNHALKVRDGKTEISKLPYDPVFAELYYMDKKDDIKKFKMNFERQTGIKFSELTFSKEGRPLNEIISMLGKSICEKANGNKEKIISLLEDAITVLKQKVDKFKDIVKDRFNCCKKTYEFMNLNLLEMMEQQKKIKNEYYLTEVIVI